MNTLTLGLIAALAWGFHDFLVRFITQKTTIGSSILSVLVIGFCFQLAITFGTGSFEPLDTGALKMMFGAGIFFVLANWGLYGAFQRGPVWLAAPVVACFSVLSVAVAAVQGSAITLDQWLAVALVLVGITIVSSMSQDKDAKIPSKAPTILYGLAAALGFAGTFAFGQAATELSNEMLSALVTRIVAIGIMVGVLFTFRLPFWPGRKALWVLALMGLTDCIAILSIVSAGGMANPEYTSVATSMYGLPAIWLAATFMNETMNWRQWVGCLVAFAGVGYLAL